jgi:hypothetical protein
LTKKVAKNQAATMMYNKLRNITSNIVTLKKNIHENKVKDNGISDDPCAGLNRESAIAAVIDAPVPTLDDDKRAGKVNKRPMLEMSNLIGVYRYG